MYTTPPISSGLLHILCRVPLVGIVATTFVVLSVFFPGNVPKECMPEHAVTFTFDYGYKSVIDNAYPILERYDTPATAYIITGKVGEPNYMTWEDLKFLQEHEWEIGSHTVTHPHLTELTRKQIYYELSQSKFDLISHNLEVESFASPYGEYNQKVLDIIRKDYSSHRTVEPGLNEIPLSGSGSRYKLKAVVATTETTVEELENWILKAKKERKWLILLFHRIGEQGEYNWSIEKFKEIVEFVNKQGCQPIQMNMSLKEVNED